MIAKDDPVTCQIYAIYWILMVGSDSSLLQSVKRRSHNTAWKYKNGYEVLQTYNKAMKLDKKNGNDQRQEVVNIENQQ
jgi:hypothetical protein